LVVYLLFALAAFSVAHCSHAAEALAEANMLTAKIAARMTPATLNKDFMTYFLLYLGWMPT
jgi:hypothetical protein